MARSKDSVKSPLSKNPFRRKPKDPNKKPGRIAQMRRIYTVSRQTDPSIGWWMLLTALVVVIVMLIVGFFLRQPILFAVFSLPFALMGAMLVMSRRAERAAYKSIEGKAGATGAALGALRKGWYYDKEPVAAEAPRGRNARDLASAAMIFRAVGRPGVVLVAEGPKGAAVRLAESERKKITRVTGGTVPVTILRVGEGDDAVPVNKLARRITKLKPKLTKAEVSAVNKRLKALGGMKPPVPAGVDPSRARMDRKGLKGR